MLGCTLLFCRKGFWEFNISPELFRFILCESSIILYFMRYE